MATVKLNSDGKVILKNNKVSCECCVVCNGPTSGVNVFQITKEEYDNYYKGGTWNVSGTVTIQESTSTGNSSNGTSGGSFSVQSYGCNFSHYESFKSIVTYIENNGTPGDISYQQSYGISYNLGRSGVNFYIYLCGGVPFNEGTVTCNNSGGTGQGTPTANIDGNNIQLISNWLPGWMGLPGYSNTSTSNLIATFTPAQ
jgi:hypothetical protein